MMFAILCTQGLGISTESPLLSTVSRPRKYSVCACVLLSYFSRVWLFATLWTVIQQAPLYIGFFRQKYRSGLHAFFQGIFPTQGLNPYFLQLLHCRWILSHWATREAHSMCGYRINEYHISRLKIYWPKIRIKIIFSVTKSALCV